MISKELYEITSLIKNGSSETINQYKEVSLFRSNVWLFLFIFCVIMMFIGICVYRSYHLEHDEDGENSGVFMFVIFLICSIICAFCWVHYYACYIAPIPHFIESLLFWR